MDFGMIKTDIQLIKLTALEGMTLTDGQSLGKQVYLGINDSIENWYEITDSEAQAIRERQANELLSVIS